MLKVVRSKRYPEDISKDKGKNLLSENLRRTLKSLMGRGARIRGGILPMIENFWQHNTASTANRLNTLTW